MTPRSTPRTRASTPAPPFEVIGRYAIYGHIASGGMASVHFGRQLGEAGRAHAAWQSGLDAIDQVSGSHSSLVLRTRWSLLMRLGRATDAAVIAAELPRQGDHHPAWLREHSARTS